MLASRSAVAIQAIVGLFLLLTASTTPARAQSEAERALDLDQRVEVVELRGQGRFDEAERRARAGLAEAEKKYGPDHDITGHWATQVGLSLQAQGKYAQAEPFFKRALAIMEKRMGPDSEDTARALNDLGSLYTDQSRFAEAEAVIKAALAKSEKASGPQSRAVADKLNMLALLYITQGRSKEAEALLRRVVAIDEKTIGPDHRDTASTFVNLGDVLSDLGRYQEAEQYYKRAIAIDEKLDPDHPRTAIDYSNLALLYQTLDRYNEAEALYRRAINILERKGGDQILLSTALTNFGSMLSDLGRYDEADPLLRRALAISETTTGPEHPDTALSLKTLARNNILQGKRTEGRALMERYLRIMERTLGPDNPTTAAALVEVANLYADDRRFADAEAMHKRAIAIMVKSAGSDNVQTAQAKGGLAMLYLRMQRLADAEAIFRETLAIFERGYPPGHPAIAMVNYRLAYALAYQDKFDEALVRARTASALIAARRARGTMERLTGGWRESFNLDRVFALHVSIAFAQSRRRPAQAAALRAEGFATAQHIGTDDTGRAVAAMAARFAAGTDALAALLREQQGLLRRQIALDRKIANTLGSNDPATRAQLGDLQRENDAISARLRAIDQTLRANHPAYAELIDPKPLSLTEAQSLLSSDEAIVMPLVFDEGIVLFALTRSDTSWASTVIPAADVERQIGALRLQLDPNLWPGQFAPFDRTLAHKLYQETWAPIAATIANKRQVFVVPNGPLTSLPLAVLVTETPAGGNGGDADPNALRETPWLAKRHALITLPSITSLKALRVFANKGSGDQPFAGFGNPALGGAARTVAPPRTIASIFRGTIPDPGELRTLPPLPATAGELRALAKALGASETTDVFLRERATERAVKSLDLSRKRVIAFATHALTTGEMGLGEPGLVFTPPGQSNELDDGYLTASEAAGLNLRADWIILSACNTAAADKPGASGLSGLARAFFLAGARSLLVSHWPVWDDVASRLTTTTVKNFQADPRAGRADALRKAMLDIMNDKSSPRFAHPAAWAPFILAGETNAN